MEEVNHRIILLVTLGLLFIAFFSHTLHFGTGYSVLPSRTFDCRDYFDALAHYQSGRNARVYDMDGDGILEEDDLSALYALATDPSVPCGLPDKCLEEGRLSCTSDKHVISRCIKDEFGRLIPQRIACSKGMACASKTFTLDLGRGVRKNVRTAYCEYERFAPLLS